MEESTENISIIKGDFIQNFLDNWINIAIIAGAFVILVIIISIIRSRLSRFFERKIPANRMLIKKRTLTFNSVMSNLIIIAAFIAT
ncbi:MAG: hypothetical protein MUO59_06155, partial [Actinobacteria bacterium]|nr:hypothetical protein [Actinomycetota bacterium]